jgi:hypothetical protein
MYDVNDTTDAAHERQTVPMLLVHTDTQTRNGNLGDVQERYESQVHSRGGAQCLSQWTRGGGAEQGGVG